MTPPSPNRPFSSRPARTAARTARTFALLSLTLALIALGCSSGLGKLVNRGAVNTIASVNILQGFDLGQSSALPQEIEDVAITGGEVPALTEAGNQEYVFVAFTTRTDRTQVAETTGTPGFEMSSVTDGNDSSDLYLAVVSKALIGGQPTAFNQALIETFHNDRCIQCHGFRSPTQPTFTSFGSSGNGAHIGGPDSNCLDCHNAETTGLHTDGNLVDWDAPTGLDFRRTDGTKKDAAELVAMLEAFEADPAHELTATEHLKLDDKILWAIDRGTVPQDGQLAPGGDVPIDSATWNAQVDAWEAGGRQVTTADTIQDIALVSAIGGFAVGDCSEPSLTFVPNPAFDPALPGGVVGTVYVAFVSRAPNLVAPPVAPAANVYRAEVLVFETGGSVAFVVNGQELISHDQANPTIGGNADSSRPAISPDGMTVTFESRATNLTPFVDQNGASAPDIFVKDLTLGQTTLVSRSTAGPTLGGNAGSFRPALDDDVVVFESDASNLVTGDSNGGRDIFRLDLGGALVRVSERADGTEASGGDSRHASVVGDRVVFESTKRNLTNAALPAASNIFLWDGASATSRVTLLSRAGGGANGAPGNGSSSRPVLSPSGNAVYFETLATNLDSVRTSDTNNASDVVRCDLGQLPERLEVERVSVTSAGLQGDGDSDSILAAEFRRPSGSAAPEFALFRTVASNLGAPVNTGWLISLIDPNSNPSVSFTALPDRPVGLVGELFTFDGSASTDLDPEDGIASFAWSVSALDEPIISHVFPTPGLQTVTLTGLDTRGGQATATLEIQINASNSPPTSVPGSYAPVAALAPVAFDASASFDPNPGDAIVSYQWDFGDGEGSTEIAATHAYLTPGTYPVTLTVEDYFGATSVATTDVVVVAANPTFVDVYTDIIDPRCGGCHGAGDPYFDASSADPADAFSGIRFGDGTAPCYSGVDYVIPGFPDDSLFLIKVDVDLLSGFPGGCGASSLMPSPTNPLPESDILRLRLWIEQGAVFD